MDVYKIALGILIVGVGLYVIVSRKRLARSDTLAQNKLFGFHLGLKEIKTGEIGAMVAGLITIAIGLWFLVQGTNLLSMQP